LPNFHGYSSTLPRLNDRAPLFLIHMLSKMQPWEPENCDKSGSRITIVFNGSPLFPGSADSSESEIRRRIIEHCWLEAIVALPGAARRCARHGRDLRQRTAHRLEHRLGTGAGHRQGK